MKTFSFCLSFLLLSIIAKAQSDTISLNGTWQFDQTETAIPPQRFTRHIKVPGLIYMAEPNIEDYDIFFKKPKGTVYQEQHNLKNRDYIPKYSWYYRTIFIPKEKEGIEAVITLLKSQYLTRIWVNDMEVGSSIQCYTPIEFPITEYLKFGAENKILVQVGDRAWLPSAAAGSIDKEKVHYFPGIWDNVFVTFSGKFQVNKTLLLPDLKNKKVTAKLEIRSFYPPQLLVGNPMLDSCTVQVDIKEKNTGKIIASAAKIFSVKRDNITEVAVDVLFENPHLWTPDDPFLYVANVRLLDSGKLSDEADKRFGMREFSRDGKFFTLNGKKILLRGTNITLHRFFEDPECQALPWDREWVRRLLTEYPKKYHWNAMRICVGIVPDFWYDIADSAGLMLQNEWMYWQIHGWDDEIKKEYTNWVWSDGNHPSIVIWDAINENWDQYIGTKLIPELKKLDPSRIWDAGYMTAETGAGDDMDEPHPYIDFALYENYTGYRNQHPLPLGDLNYTGGGVQWKEQFLSRSVPQLVNEYGWIWLWRDGTPSKLTIKNYDYYVGPEGSVEERRNFQAYSLQLQTEWLRAQRSLAGVLQFCYLTNNYGFTGDGFIGKIADLKPSPMMKWFQHCFAPSAVFINLEDERYVKNTAPHAPSSQLSFVLTGVNDIDTSVKGNVKITLLDSQGKVVFSDDLDTAIPGFGRKDIPYVFVLPAKPDGYLLLAKYTPTGNKDSQPAISRRYLKVGNEKQRYHFYDFKLKEN